MASPQVLRYTDSLTENDNRRICELVDSGKTQFKIVDLLSDGDLKKRVIKYSNGRYYGNSTLLSIDEQGALTKKAKLFEVEITRLMLDRGYEQFYLSGNSDKTTLYYRHRRNFLERVRGFVSHILNP